MRKNDTIKYVAGGAATLAFVVGVVWLVRSEGERTREAMREAAKEAGNEVREGLVEGAERAVDKAAELPGKVIRDVKDELPEGLSEAAGDAVGEVAKLPGKVIRGVQDEMPEDLPETVRRTVDEASKLPGKVLGDVADVVRDSPDEPRPRTSPESMPPPAEPPAEDVVKIRPEVRQPTPNVQPPPLVTPIPHSHAPTLPQPVYPHHRNTYQAYHHASTAAEGRLRGMADLARSQGQANLDNSAAAINYSLARRNEMDNRLHWTHTFFQMRQANRAYRAMERGPRPTMEDCIRYAQMGKPKRLSPSELDTITGEIHWPLLLTSDEFAGDRSELESVFARRASCSAIGLEDYLKIRDTTDQMLAKLKGQIREAPARQYIIAKRFVESLAYEADLPPA